MKSEGPEGPREPPDGPADREGSAPESAGPGESSAERRREVEHERRVHRDVVAVLLAVAAVIAAVIGGRSALMAEKASDYWQSSIREDVKQGAGVFEITRFVYEENATPALQSAEARLLSQEFRRAAEGQPAEAQAVLEAEAVSQEGFATAVERSSPEVGDDRYGKGVEYDVAQRLADEVARYPDILEVDPAATEAKGSVKSTESSLLAASGILVAMAFALGALSEGFHRLGRRLVPLGFVIAALGLVAAVLVEVTH